MSLTLGLLARRKELLLHVNETQAANVAGGSIPAAGVNVRGLNNTVTNTIRGASRTGAQVTLAPGDYEVEARSVSWQTGRARLQLFDVTNAAVALLGMSAFGSSLKSVEAQILLAGLGIRPVTMEALIRKDWPDVAVEVDFFLGRKHGHDGE